MIFEEITRARKAPIGVGVVHVRNYMQEKKMRNKENVQEIRDEIRSQSLLYLIIL